MTLVSLPWWAWWTERINDPTKFTLVSMMNWGNQWLGINWGLTDPTELTLIRMINSGITVSIELTLVSMINWGNHWHYRVYLGEHDKMRVSLTLLSKPWCAWQTEGITDSIKFISLNWENHWPYWIYPGEYEELRESLNLLILPWSAW